MDCPPRACGVAILLVGVLCGCAQAASTLEVRVEQMLADGDTAAAIDLLEHNDLESSDSPALMVTLGRLHRNQGTIEGRLASQKVLERANALFPHRPEVLLELGLTYFAQTFYPDACRRLRECVELDPDNCEAMYKLGVSEYEHWKLRVNAWLDDADDACDWLSAALECDPTNVDAAERLTGALYGTNQVERALDRAGAFARRFPDEWFFPLFIGAVAYERSDMARADSAFVAGIAMMSESERDAFTRIGRNTLGYADRDVFDDLNGGEQTVMNRGFWVNADPDPTTELNERALENIYRTFMADVYFSASKPHITWTRPQTRGWDTERGETLIKFGWPDTIIASQSHIRWERWVYGKDTEDEAEFEFVDSFMNGRYQIPPYSANMSFIRFADRVTQYAPEWIEIDGAMDVTAFREDNFTATIYASIDVGGREIDSLEATAFATRLRLFRDDWDTDVASEQAVDLADLARMTAPEGAYYGYVRRCEVPFDNYHVAAAFEDVDVRVHALFRGAASTERFMKPGVQLSDILLERESEDGPTIERAGEVRRPNPWAAYGPGQSLLTYVEVYDLAVRAGASRYVLRYSIQESRDESPTAWNRLGRVITRLARREAKPIVTQSMERTGSSHSDSAALAIDVSVLSEGRYTITVGVDDLIGGTSVEVSEPFYKVGVSLADDR